MTLSQIWNAIDFATIIGNQTDYLSNNGRYQQLDEFAGPGGSTLYIDEYLGPQGPGYILHAEAQGHCKQQDFGPEGRNRDWYVIPPSLDELLHG